MANTKLLISNPIFHYFYYYGIERRGELELRENVPVSVLWLPIPVLWINFTVLFIPGSLTLGSRELFSACPRECPMKYLIYRERGRTKRLHCMKWTWARVFGSKITLYSFCEVLKMWILYAGITISSGGNYRLSLLPGTSSCPSMCALHGAQRKIPLKAATRFKPGTPNSSAKKSQPDWNETDQASSSYTFVQRVSNKTARERWFPEHLISLWMRNNLSWPWKLQSQMPTHACKSPAIAQNHHVLYDTTPNRYPYHNPVSSCATTEPNTWTNSVPHKQVTDYTTHVHSITMVMESISDIL